MRFERDTTAMRRSVWLSAALVAFGVWTMVIVWFLPVSLIVVVPAFVLMGALITPFLCVAVTAWRFTRTRGPLLSIDAEGVVANAVPGAVPSLAREAVSDVAVGWIPGAQVLCFRTASDLKSKRAAMAVADRLLLSWNLRRGRGAITVVDLQLGGSIDDVVRVVEAEWPEVTITALDD